MFTVRRMHALGALRYAPTESDLNVIQKNTGCKIIHEKETTNARMTVCFCTIDCVTTTVYLKESAA